MLVLDLILTEIFIWTLPRTMQLGVSRGEPHLRGSLHNIGNQTDFKKLACDTENRKKIPRISIYPNLVLFGAVFLTKNTIYTLFWCFCALTTYSGYTSNKIKNNWVWDARLELKKVFEIQFDRFDCARKRSSEVFYEKITIALFLATLRWTFCSELDLELTFFLPSKV